MARLVQFNDIDGTTPQLVSVNTTATLSASRLGLTRRIFFSVIPITAGVTATVVLGDGTPAANTGIPLIQNQPFSMADDASGAGCFQGPIQCVTSGAGQVAFTEIFDRSSDI